ncbi:hypothetical protein ACHAXS_003451 [Conticribra weissflogii]
MMQNFHDYDAIASNRSNNCNGIISNNSDCDHSTRAEALNTIIDSNPSNSTKRVYSICNLSCSSESYKEYAALFDFDKEAIADEEASWSISSHSAECWLCENENSISTSEFQNVFVDNYPANKEDTPYEPWEYDVEEGASKCSTPEDDVCMLDRIPQTISFSRNKVNDEASISENMSQMTSPVGNISESHPFQPKLQPQVPIISQYLCNVYVPFSRRFARRNQQHTIPAIKAERITPVHHENKHASNTLFHPHAVSPTFTESDCMHFNQKQTIDRYLSAQSARNYSYNANIDNCTHMNEISVVPSSASNSYSELLHDSGIKKSIDANMNTSNELPSKQSRPQRKRKDLLEGISMGFFSGQKVDLETIDAPAPKHSRKKTRKPKKDLLANVEMGYFSNLAALES